MINKLFWYYYFSVFCISSEYFYRIRQFLWNKIADRFMLFILFKGNLLIDKSYKIDLYKFNSIAEYKVL